MTFKSFMKWEINDPRTYVLGIVAILFVTSLVYIPAMQADFIWDDDAFLTNNRIMKAEDGIRRFWASTEPPDYFPLTSSMLWFEWQMWEMNATGYHVVNIILHIISSVLIWLVLKQLKIPGAFIAAMVFAVHPVNVEAVAWITQRKTTLPMVFYLLSILFFLYYDATGKRKFYLVSLLAFPLALLAKTSVVMQPFALLGCIWWQRKKISKQDLIRVLPYFGIAFALSLVTIWFQYNRSIGDDIVRTDSFIARLAGVGWVVWFYLYKALLPLKLTFVYPRWEIDPHKLVSWIPNLGLICTFVVLWWKRQSWGRPCLFALGYFAITLFPMIGFFNIYYFRYSLVADHYQYQSIIGIIALTVGAVYYFVNKKENLRQPATVIATIVLVLLGTQTFLQSRHYQNVETIFLDTIAKNPTSWMPLYNLGHYHQDNQNYQKAVYYYSKGIDVQPDNPDPHNNLGNLYLAQKNYEKSLQHFKLALEIEPDYAVTHYNMGTALMEIGRHLEATDHFFKALDSLRSTSRKVKAHNNLANALANLGRNHQALAHYREALRLAPEFTDAKRNMEIVLKRIRREPAGSS